MKLQAALDTLTLEQCIELLHQTDRTIEIAEVGTPFIIEEGMKPVQTIKELFPHIEVLADAKIMDAGEFEADKCFSHGADIVTVLGVAYDETIEGVVKSARKYGKKVMADMIAVTDLAKRAEEIDRMGVDYICVHTAFDIQGTGKKDPLIDLKTVNAVIKNAQSAVAGRVNLFTIAEIAKEAPGIIVVGGAICNAADKADAAKQLKERMSV